MALSPKVLKLKQALEAAGVVVGSSQDQVLDAAIAWTLETAAQNGPDFHSSGPQCDAPAKPKRTKKSS